jgi:DNA-binding response OmpR family regulator
LVAQATGIQSRWIANPAELDGPEQRDGSVPEAFFVDVRLSIEGTESGPHLISRLKGGWPLSPVILTAAEQSSDLLAEAMAMGADDFIAKPIAAADLAHRFSIRKNALVRRAARESIIVGDMTIDTLQRTVTSERGQRFLSPTEVRLVAELAKAGGAVVSRDELKHRCWPAEGVSDNALNRKLYEIRRRLKPLSERVNIRTIYGVGFVMEQK